MYNYTYNEIVKALQTVGIKQGDNIFCHANLGFFGKLENAQTPDDYCKCFKNAFLDVIGPDGTLICPTFSYSFCRKEIFNPEKTKSTCGSFSEYMRKRKGSVRSYDANFSICAIGKNAQFFTQNPPEHSFGPDSFFDRFYKKNGVFCNLNFDSGSTFIHYVEKTLQVPYRWDKAFDGVLEIEDKQFKKRFYHFVCSMENDNHKADFSKFDKLAKEKNITKTANLGRGQIVYISAHDTYDLIKREIKETPNLLIKGEI